MPARSGRLNFAARQPFVVPQKVEEFSRTRGK